MGLEILDLAGDAGKGSTDDADLAARLDIRLVDLKGDAQALDIFTGLGIDEVLHLLLGDREDLALLFPTPPGPGHELDREEVRIGVLEGSDNLLRKHPTPFWEKLLAPASAGGWGIPIRLD